MNTFRNPDMLERLERHPMRASLAKVLDAAETFIGDAEFVGKDRNLSEAGRVGAIEKHLRAALRDIRDHRAPITEMKTKVKAKRAVIKQPEFDRTDVVGAMNRQELRAALRTMPFDQRAALLTDPNTDPAFVDAVIEQPAMLSGFAANPMEMQIYDQLKEQRLQSLFGPQLAEIAEMENTIAEAQMIVDVVGVDMQAQSGLRPERYAEMKRVIETKANAPWLKNSTNDKGENVIFTILPGMQQARPSTPDEIRDGKFYSNIEEYQADRAAA